MKTATCIRRDLPKFRGSAALYKLSEPVKTSWSDDDDSIPMTGYVIASAINNDFGMETLVFPARENGTVISHCDIGGGRGYHDTDRAVREMGYELVP